MAPLKTRRLPPGCTIDQGANCFKISITWGEGGWRVAYPIIPEPTEVIPGQFVMNYPFRPGQVPQWNTMPLNEFLNMLAEEYNLPYVMIANVGMPNKTDPK